MTSAASAILLLTWVLQTTAPAANVAPHEKVDLILIEKSARTHRQMDWTDGCVAVTDAEIQEIDPLVAVGRTVEIQP